MSISNSNFGLINLQRQKVCSNLSFSVYRFVMSIDVVFLTVNTASNLFKRSPMKTSGGVQEPSGSPHSPYRYTPYTSRAQQRPSQSLSPGATSQQSPSTPLHQQPPLTPQYSPQAAAYSSSPLSVPPQSVDVPDRGGDMSLLGVPSPPQGRLCYLCIL